MHIWILCIYLVSASKCLRFLGRKTRIELRIAQFSLVITFDNHYALNFFTYIFCWFIWYFNFNFWCDECSFLWKKKPVEMTSGCIFTPWIGISLYLEDYNHIFLQNYFTWEMNRSARNLISINLPRTSKKNFPVFL